MANAKSASASWYASVSRARHSVRTSSGERTECASHPSAPSARTNARQRSSRSVAATDGRWPSAKSAKSRCTSSRKGHARAGGEDAGGVAPVAGGEGAGGAAPEAGGAGEPSAAGREGAGGAAPAAGGAAPAAGGEGAPGGEDAGAVGSGMSVALEDRAFLREE